MKQDFKKWLNTHKNKPLTKELIALISQNHEDEIGQMMCDEGLSLESSNTGKNILFGRCEKDGKDWCVQNYQWETEKEFKTLKGAINYANA